MEKQLERSPPFDELLLGIWRQKKVVLLFVAMALGVGAIYGLLTPKKYRASAAVRMDLQVLPEQYVSPTVTETAESRIATIRHALLGEQVLARIVREENLFPELVERHGLPAAVEALRGRIEVRVEGENAYVVSHEARDAEEAARIANRIPAVYAEIASEERAQAAARAAAIFEAELQNIRPQVENWESKLAAFKAQHAERLPEVLESNLRQLDRLSGLIEATLLSLSDAQRRHTTLARMGAESNVEVGRLAAVMNEARREYMAARSTYTEDHPETLNAERAYRSAKARYEAAAEEVSRGDNEERRVLEEIRWLRELALDYQRRSDAFMRRVEATPAVGAQLEGILREYDVVREKYATLLSRKVEAELAEDLERRQRGSLFRIIEPAIAPLSPAEPKPLQLLLLSLLGGMGAGIAVASYRASRDTSVRGASDARQRLGVPVLASVPSIDKRHRRASPQGE